ncbi:MAG: PP2C family protein-serine/threonine phosphatase [Blastocatellia bacterium]|nr:PP2C family protein-serine/threonine phosphatase [Blastocatellia bacterium]
MSLSTLSESRLEALLESAQLLHSSLDLDGLLRHLLRSVMGRLLASKGLIAVVKDGVMRIELVRGLPKLAAGDVFAEESVRAQGIDTILPIGAEHDPVGLLAINRPQKKEIGDEECEFIRALLGIAASGIANARAHAEANELNKTLDQKVQELRTLLDLVRGLTSTLEPDEVAQLLMLTLAGRWAVRRCMLVAWKDGHPTVTRRKGMEIDLSHETYRALLSGLPDAMKVEELPECDLRTRLMAEQAELIFQINAGDETTGGIVVLGPRPGRLSYNESDLEFGMGLVAQAAVAFENSWYFREAIDRKKVEQELALAATIQQNLFPASLPLVPNYDMAARNRPARICGGDYYDALASPESGVRSPESATDIRLRTPDFGLRTLLICVADVSGKGLPASLLMSNMQATLRALLGRIPSLTELATHTNALLYATTPSNKYVTAILLELDPATGKGRYVNAGHTDCLLLRSDGEAEWLKSTGTPLGLMAPDMIELMQPYEERSFDLRPGDLVSLFSDGVTEAQNEDGDEYGEARLADLLRPIAGHPAEVIVSKVYEEIDRFAGSAPQYDDITLFIIRRTE